MISALKIYKTLQNSEIDFFTGVPDSLLKDFCACISENAPKNKHVIAANEGNALALAAGHYLATKNPAVVYMQNSGVGNAINPLLSLVDKEVYEIPVLLFVGWRGEPGLPDEPQHAKQGKVTDKILQACGIDFEILPDDEKSAEDAIKSAVSRIRKTLEPFAFIVKKGTFEKYEKQTAPRKYEMSREEAICAVAEKIGKNAVVVSTTGQITRELYEFRERTRTSHATDFLTVGSMGHASSIAAAIALEKPETPVFVFDGDGAFLMHAGAVPVIASLGLKNFKHVVFDNEAHDSVGAQKTCANIVDFKAFALACSYRSAFSVATKSELEQTLPRFLSAESPALLEIKVNCGARKDLGRPKEKPSYNKTIFMENLS